MYYFIKVLVLILKYFY